MAEDRLPGTAPLTEAEDLAHLMVAGIHRYLDAALEEAEAASAYAPDPEVRRAELARRIGAVDPRLPPSGLEPAAAVDAPPMFARNADFEVQAVRWRVLDGVDGEGLYLRPSRPPAASVVCLGDADQLPESLAGCVAGLPEPLQIARRLAEAGCEVVVPVLVDRDGRWAQGRPHREYVWRMAFEMGRHIIGYEVQKILALVDGFEARGAGRAIGLYGHGEGGLLALHAAALDPRIAATAVCGHFRRRSGVWREPVYRDVWGLLRGWGDAELAALVAPRGLVVVACPGPLVEGPPSGVRADQDRSAGSLGDIPAEEVRREAVRAARVYAAAGAAGRFVLVAGEGQRQPPVDAGSGVVPFLQMVGVARSNGAAAGEALRRVGDAPDPDSRQHRQFRQLCDHSLALLRGSAAKRKDYWKAADRVSPEAWSRSREEYRTRFHEELLGRCPPPTLPANPRSRLAYEAPGWQGFEVTLDLWPGVFACGILVLPRDLGPGERRPVVVCQHGLESHARIVISEPEDGCHAFGARLADRGFIVYAPQNPYIGGEAFRAIQRKAHPLQLSLFSFIIAQHARTLEWLAAQPWADPTRIGFYGISYGGMTAMRAPAVLTGYCLSICSANFNEWAVKCAGEDPFSYQFTPEYDMYEFNLGHTFNYAEMAGLIAPRPFMVERGHRDGVGADEWVAFEYAKVRRLYAALGIAERTEIEFFDGGHEIHGQGTFAFLERHLGHPRGG